MKASRLLLYVFTVGCATTLTLFVVSLLFYLDRPPANEVLSASPQESAPLKPRPDAMSTNSAAERASNPKSHDVESTKPAISSEIQLEKLSDTLESAELQEMRSATAVTTQETAATVSPDGDAPDPSKLTPISGADSEGHIVASQVIGLEVDSEFDQLLAGIGVTFAFAVLDASAHRASEMQGLHGLLRLDFVVRAGLPDVATVFRRDPTVLKTIPLRLGRGEIALLEALPDTTQPTSKSVASAIYADLVPVNLIEALLEVGSAVDAPIWIEVDGYRTVLSSVETQHVLDVISEVKRQHQMRWRAELFPGSGIRYMPR